VSGPTETGPSQPIIKTMSCFGSGEKNEKPKELVARDNRIQEQLEKHGSELKLTAKILLLGTGESGKSTVYKQLNIIHKNAYPPEECIKFKDIIVTNVLDSIRALIEACDNLGVEFGSPEMKELADKVMAIPEETIDSAPLTVLTPEMAGIVKQLWADKGIKEVFERRGEFQLTDSASYFLDKIDTIVSPDYIPSRQDVVRSRLKTVGVMESEFNVDGHTLKIVDVGGQRNERRKWIHVFDEVTLIIFVISLSEYDMKLAEDESTNRMRESLRLFEEMCNSRYFKRTPIIIFFNKMDFFEEKIKKIDLNVCFPDYTGGKNLENAKKFISQKYLDSNRNKKDREIYVHFTTATETDSIKSVFDNVKSIVLSQLRKSV
jgi:GTPase SAR1 family protein